MMKLIVIFGLIFWLNGINAQKVNLVQPLKYLALGDSYTAGTSVPVEDSYPYQLRDYLEQAGLEIDTFAVIARNGWTTGNLLAGIEEKDPAGEFNFVSLLIGVNNQYQGRSTSEYEQDFEKLLQMAVNFAGNKTRVIVLSIPDYGYTPFGQNRQEEISQEIDIFNRINRNITDAYGITYINITDLTRQGLENPEYVAGDGLHPSGLMYSLWVNRIKALLTWDPDFENEVSSTDRKKPEKIPVSVQNKKVIFHMQEEFFTSSARLAVFSMTGKKIHQGPFSRELDLQKQPEGIYFYRIDLATNESLHGKFLLS